MERIRQILTAPETSTKSLVPQKGRALLLASRLMLAILGLGGAACTTEENIKLETLDHKESSAILSPDQQALLGILCSSIEEFKYARPTLQTELGTQSDSPDGKKVLIQKSIWDGQIARTINVSLHKNDKEDPEKIAEFKRLASLAQIKTGWIDDNTLYVLYLGSSVDRETWRAKASVVKLENITKKNESYQQLNSWIIHLNGDFSHKTPNGCN